MLRANRPIIAFFDAIKSLRIRQLALILKAGYDPNLMINSHGQNGLQFMINYFGATEAHFRLQVPINKSTYLSMAKLLLDSGLDANALDLLTEETVIFDAIRFNDKEMVALLLNYVDLSLRNKSGETALMCAARFGSKQVTRMLLEHLRQLEMDGYFLRQRNRYGLTALELARAENLEAAKALTKHLIAYGQHAGAVLARSSSHHQLRDPTLSRSFRPAPLRPTGTGASLGAAARHPALYVDPSDYSLGSDLSDGELFAPLGQRPGPQAGRTARVGVAAASRTATATYVGPYYDPKAAEFNAYLLDQQQEERELGGARLNSDEEDYNNGGEETGGGGGGGAASEGTPGPGQLMRSRSCMLGPSAQGGGAKVSGAGPSGPGGQKRAAGGGRAMRE